MVLNSLLVTAALRCCVYTLLMFILVWVPPYFCGVSLLARQRPHQGDRLSLRGSLSQQTIREPSGNCLSSIVDKNHLHWLPIRQRIMYKLSTIVYKCIHGAAPSYLTNLCVPVATNTSRRYLRSATHGDLLVPRTRTVTYGPWSFAVSGPTVWNTLPSTLRVSTTTLGQFQSGLKIILFRLAYGTWLGAFVTV